MKISLLNKLVSSFISNYQKEPMQTSNNIFSFCGDKNYEGNNTKRSGINNHNTSHKIDLLRFIVHKQSNSIIQI